MTYQRATGFRARTQAITQDNAISPPPWSWKDRRTILARYCDGSTTIWQISVDNHNVNDVGIGTRCGKSPENKPSTRTRSRDNIHVIAFSYAFAIIIDQPRQVVAMMLTGHSSIVYSNIPVDCTKNAYVRRVRKVEGVQCYEPTYHVPRELYIKNPADSGH